MFVASGARAERRAVQVGARNQSMAWIERGLDAGERVVVYPPETLREGVRIAPR